MKKCQHKFPKDFLWGGAVTAHQSEGGYNEGRKLPAVCDLTVTGEFSDFKDGIDSFHRYKEDFDKCEMMDFEFLKIPVPVNYHAILSRTYGDYMKFVIGTSLHGNVFFDTDKSYTEYTNR